MREKLDLAVTLAPTQTVVLIHLVSSDILYEYYMNYYIRYTLLVLLLWHSV